MHAVLVVRRGRLVGELYRTAPDHPINVLYGIPNPFAADVAFDAETLHDVRSVSKSVVGLVFGIAVGDARLSGVSTPVLGAYPELADLRTPERDAITFEQLLTMSTGLEWKEWGEGPLTSDETRLFWKADPVRFVLERPSVAPPGARFN